MSATDFQRRGLAGCFCLWRGESWAPPCDHQTHSSTFLGSDTVGVEVVQCTGCHACYWAVVSCATVGSGLCRVLPNDFLRTQTRGMLLWRWPPAPFSHAPSTMSACTKATGRHTGRWNNPKLFPGCPRDCHHSSAHPIAQHSQNPILILLARVLRWVSTHKRQLYPNHGRCAHGHPSAHPFSRAHKPTQSPSLCKQNFSLLYSCS